MVQEEFDDPYLIKKGSYYYRPKCKGYTNYVFAAGRYTKEFAYRECSKEPEMVPVRLAEMKLEHMGEADRYIRSIEEELRILRHTVTIQDIQLTQLLGLAPKKRADT